MEPPVHALNGATRAAAPNRAVNAATSNRAVDAAAPNRAVRAAVALLLAGLIGLPVVAGLIGTALPAFGLLPSVGAASPGLAAWRDLAATPGLATSLRLTIVTGTVSAGLATLLALGLAASWRGRVSRMAVVLAPLLATPHAAMAIGLAFLLAPSGWIARLVSALGMGWSVPPDVTTVGDPFGLALILGLLVKEVPYLLLVTIAALEQVPVGALLRAGRALGYRPGQAWIALVLPRIYPQIRLPVLIVLAFALSVADMALVLGPGHPPTLALLALRWLQAPDIALYPCGAAAALLLLGVVGAALGLWCLMEVAVAALGRRWIASGRRGAVADGSATVARTLVLGLCLVGALGLVLLVVWSVAWRWPFPAAWPVEWSFATWRRQSHALGWPVADTLTLGLGVAAAGLLLAVATLHSGIRAALPRSGATLVVLPLLLPQIAFLFGFQVLLARWRLDGTLLAVGWAHLPFVFAYIMIALADPWAALDRRYARAAAALGASPLRILVAVRLPMLRRPLLIAGAVGFAVSVAQYLPTLFAGAGRVATLTTEAVTLSSGADRRIVGVYGTLQLLLPLLAYAGAVALPTLPRRR